MDIEKKNFSLIPYLKKSPKYPRETSFFINWLENRNLDLTTENISSYLEYLKSENYAPRTYNVKLTALKESIRWVFKNSSESLDLKLRMRLEEFLSSLKPYKVQTVSVPEDKILSKEEIEHLKSKVSNRLRLIITFLYHTGLRVSEMIGIKQIHIRSNGVYHYIQIYGKGNKVREIKCRKELLQEIQEEFAGKTYLFESKKWRSGNEGGNPLDRHNITKEIKKAGRKYLNKEISSHTFRHSLATHLIQDGKNLKAVSGYLGHSSVKTTLDLYVHENLELDDLPL